MIEFIESKAIVEIVGAERAVLISQNQIDIVEVSHSGNQGATGPQGPQGATGPQGPQGATGQDGNTNVFIGATDPALATPYLWVDTSGGNLNFWVNS